MTQDATYTDAPREFPAPAPDGESKAAGPNPLAVIGAAAFAGFVVAKIVDRKGRAAGA